MKSRSLFKIMLDLVMLALFLQLMFWYGLSPLFHEVAGMAIGVLFILHVVVNWKPFKGMIAKAGHGGLGVSRTLLLATDIILPMAMPVTIITGMCIATEVWMTPGNETLTIVHNIAAYVCLFVLLLHSVLHAGYLVGCCRQMLKGDVFQKAASCMGAASLVLSLAGMNVLTGVAEAGGMVQASVAAVTTKFLPTQMSDRTVVTSSATAAAGSSPDDAAAQASATSSSAVDTTTEDVAATEDTTATETTDEVVASDTTDEVVTEDTADTTTIDQAYTADTVDTSNTPSNCTQCGRHCPITALSCGRGISWAQSNGYI